MLFLLVKKPLNISFIKNNPDSEVSQRLEAGKEIINSQTAKNEKEKKKRGKY